jgi:hypothetical protein
MIYTLKNLSYVYRLHALDLGTFGGMDDSLWYIDIDTALAAANSGHAGQMTKVLHSLFRLGPRGIARYFHYSRIVDRLLPRLRARLAGGF